MDGRRLRHAALRPHERLPAGPGLRDLPDRRGEQVTRRSLQGGIVLLPAHRSPEVLAR